MLPGPTLEARSLAKWYGLRPVLRDVDLRLERGTILAITGANGSGKTTLLRCLGGVTRCTAGEVHWFGSPARGKPAARRWMGMLGHESGLYPQITLRENLVFAARMCGVAGAGEVADRWLGEVGLAARGDCLPGQVSRGMVQRVALARAVLHDPWIILLDEPFSALDDSGAAWLEDLLAGLRNRGRTICFVTHDPVRTERLADRVCRVHAGRVEEREGPGRFHPSSADAA